MILIYLIVQILASTQADRGARSSARSMLLPTGRRVALNLTDWWPARPRQPVNIQAGVSRRWTTGSDPVCAAVTRVAGTGCHPWSMAAAADAPCHSNALPQPGPVFVAKMAKNLLLNYAMEVFFKKINTMDQWMTSCSISDVNVFFSVFVFCEGSGSNQD